ncbi:unnamed protein product [Prunus armeniaca]
MNVCWVVTFSLHDSEGKKGHEVVVQGGVIDDLARHMIEQYRIPKRFIESNSTHLPLAMARRRARAATIHLNSGCPCKSEFCVSIRCPC